MWRLQEKIVAALWAVFVFTAPALAQINSLTREGINFIPPQSVQALIDSARITRIHDE